jgi:hypothetical protein
MITSVSAIKQAPVALVRDLPILGKVGILALFILLEEGIHWGCKKILPDTHGEIGFITPKIQRRVIAFGIAYGSTLKIAKAVGLILSVPTSATIAATVSFIALFVLYYRQKGMISGVYTPDSLRKVCIRSELYIESNLNIRPGKVFLFKNVAPEDIQAIEASNGSKKSIEEYSKKIFKMTKMLSFQDVLPVKVVVDKENNTVALVNESRAYSPSSFDYEMHTVGIAVKASPMKVEHLKDLFNDETSEIDFDELQLSFITDTFTEWRGRTIEDLENYLNETIGDSQYRFRIGYKMGPPVGFKLTSTYTQSQQQMTDGQREWSLSVENFVLNECNNRVNVPFTITRLPLASS